MMSVASRCAEKTFSAFSQRVRSNCRPPKAKWAMPRADNSCCRCLPTNPVPPVTKTFMAARPTNSVQQFAQRPDAAGFQIRIIADIGAEEMDVVDDGIFFKFLAVDAAQERLAQLVAAAGRAATEFNLPFAQSFFNAIPERLVRFAQNQSEGVVATAFAVEVGVKFLRVEAVEEKVQVARALLVVCVEALQLGATEDGVEFRV